APELKLPHLLKEGKYVVISVKDCGIGIPQEYLDNIFDPYFTTKEKGSGLGLATSWSIIKNHGGEIIATSELRKGTTFFIYLPALEAEKEIEAMTLVSSVVRKGNILVMDDEDLVLNVAGEMIQALGHNVEFAKDGEAAIEKYRAARESGNPFDVVILDLTIRGGMGGKETVERLLSMDNNVKAIVTSGYSDEGVVSEYYKYGFKAFLSKPYKLGVLRDTLNAILG
ncbi:MAG: response regulator, partial [Nitrospirota bacterium]|nr:response regulator [Nitrospirota bacterium]